MQERKCQAFGCIESATMYGCFCLFCFVKLPDSFRDNLKHARLEHPGESGTLHVAAIRATRWLAWKDGRFNGPEPQPED